ncbi:hypothetical protein AWENTII_002639 [Aspergillus wentii]
MDTDGFLWFQDRQKEMIKYKGQVNLVDQADPSIYTLFFFRNLIAPAELENALSAPPDVLEAAVCGYFDESQQTDLPVGYAKLRDTVDVTDRARVLADIKKGMDDAVSPVKKLRGRLFYLAKLPKNPTGKITRAHLPARLEAAKKRAAKL